MYNSKVYLKQDVNIILNKLPSYTRFFVPLYCENIGSLLKSIEARFKLTDQGLALVEQADFPDWSNFYLKERPMNKLSKILFGLLGIEIKFSVLFLLKSLPKLIQNLPNKKSPSKATNTYFEENLLDLVFLYRAGIVDFSCYCSIGRTMGELITLAKNGNEDAFFAAIHFDRGLLTSDWAIRIIRKATLQGNEKFFVKLGETLKAPFILNENQSTFKLSLFLKVFWYLGFSKLTTEEIAAIVEHYEIYTVKDPETLRKFLNRIGFKKSTPINHSEKDILFS